MSLRTEIEGFQYDLEQLEIESRRQEYKTKLSKYLEKRNLKHRRRKNEKRK